ncbi:MAG: hypothetical protein GY851_09425 [bacterium]|nr:hypothetical protein [bacterium]
MILIRQPVDNTDVSNDMDATLVANIVDMIDGVGGHDRAVDKMAERYAYRIERKVTEDGLEYATYVRADRQHAIKNGFFEVVLVDFGRAVNDQRSTLYSEESQEWVYDNDTAEQVFNELREEGGADLALIRVDHLADSIGCGCQRVVHRDSALSWQSFAPTSLAVGFAASIESDGNMREVNACDIEEASVVVLTLGVVDAATNKNRYAAYFGRSELYPNGRHVVFVGDSPSGYPEVGGGGDEWTTAGEFVTDAPLDDIANPLTYWSNTTGTDGPEYPVVIFYGDSRRHNVELLPLTGEDLYLDSLEADVASSLILKNSLINSRGIVALKAPSGGALPNPWDQGMVHLRKDQDIEVKSVPGVNSKIAFENFKEWLKARAESMGVPGHMVVADSESGNPESGKAIALRNAPLKKTREERWRANRHSFRRWWDVSKNVYNCGEGSAVIPEDSTLKYSPGTQFFEGEDDRLADITRLEAEKTAGLNDPIGVAADYWGVTREEAAVMLEEMAKEMGEHPDLAPAAPEQPQGVLARRQLGRQ